MSVIVILDFFDSFLKYPNQAKAYSTTQCLVKVVQLGVILAEILIVFFKTF